MAYDQFGNWVEDDEMMDDGSGGFGYDLSTMFNSPYMQMAQAPGQNFSKAKWNFGAPLPFGQTDFNQVMTGVKNLNNLQTLPSLLYNAQVATGQQTMDPNALMGLDQSGMPYMGGGGGGGGGGGNGYQQVFTTPYLDALSSSQDPDEQFIYQAIQSGASSPLAIKAKIRANHPELLGEQLYPYNDTVDAAFKENAASQRNQMLGATATGERTPAQEWMAKNGLINPMDTYGPDNLPGDINVGANDVNVAGAASDALKMATSTGANIKRLNDERRGLQDKATVANGIGDVKHLLQQEAINRYLGNKGAVQQATEAPMGGNDMATARAAMSQQADVNAQQSNPNATPAVPVQGPLAQRPPYASATFAGPPQHVDTGATGGWAGGWMRPVRDAAARQLNPGGDVARMAMLKRAAAAQERRKADLAQSAQAATQYGGQGLRMIAADRLQQQGRTPARDAQRAVLRYLQQQGNLA